jgi:CBS domain containing-hemolysin-like protein
VPEVGETVTFEGLLFRCERVQGRRIVSVVISRSPKVSKLGKLGRRKGEPVDVAGPNE